MEKQAFNPYLPTYEYIPDGEPHVFGHRVYVYGSHDKFNGEKFCMGDYVCYSADIDDLKDWKYEGVIYPRVGEDPNNKEGTMCLYAPDVTCGPDGRYYLYYSYDRRPTTGVAVAAKPEGPYKYLGEVKAKDGHVIGTQDGDIQMFDPAVLTEEDGSVSLFSGQAFFKLTGLSFLMYKVVMHFINKKNKQKQVKLTMDGSYLFKLDKDMLTVKEERIKILGGEDTCPADFKTHSFFEGSSIRKFNGTYYFIYSSSRSNELAYGTSDKIEGPYKYGGSLISNADLIEEGDTIDTKTALRGGKPDKRADNFYGNNHGSIEKIKDKYYVFYHRHTNKSQFSRQECAEEITMDQNGHFKPVKMTSCGLNGGPLLGEGTYEARIACNLNSVKGGQMCSTMMPKKMTKHLPYITQDEPDGLQGQQYIANMEDGSWAGYKFFDFKGASKLSVSVRGKGQGKIEVYLDSFQDKVGEIEVNLTPEYTSCQGEMKFADGVHALFLKYVGKGHLDLMSFTISK